MIWRQNDLARNVSLFRTFALVLSASLTALTGGCGKKRDLPLSEVGGVVRLDGQPLNKVLVKFIPLVDCGPDYVSTGVTDESGRYTLKCNAGSGAAMCEHQVIVMEADIPSSISNSKEQLSEYLMSLGGRPLPQRYAAFGNNLTVEVTADRKEYNLDLTR